MTTRPTVTLQIAWHDGPGETSPTWYDIPPGDLLAWSFRMGRSAATDDTTNPGTATFVLDNSQRSYDPSNPSIFADGAGYGGAYDGDGYEATAYGLGPTPGRPVRLRSTLDGDTITLWQGIVGPAGFEQTNYRHQLSDAVINCVDLVGHADRVALDASEDAPIAAGRTLDQAQAVLNAAGLSVINTITSDAWDTEAMWDDPDRVWGDLGRFSETLDGGRTNVPAIVEPVDSVAAYLRDIEATDGGRIYFDPRRGELVGLSYQESRMRVRSAESQWYLADHDPAVKMLAGPHLSGDAVVGATLTVDEGAWQVAARPYRFEDIRIETLPLRNDVRVTVVGSGDEEVVERVTDDVSIAAYGRSSSSVSLLSTVDVDAYQVAAYQVARYARPLQVVSQMRVNPAGSTAAWPLVHGMQLFDRVTVARTPHNVGDQVSSDYIVEGIEMRAGDGVELWTVELYLSPVATDTIALWDSPAHRWDDTGRHWGL